MILFWANVADAIDDSAKAGVVGTRSDSSRSNQLLHGQFAVAERGLAIL